MKKIKILTNRAHCGHQYELWKLPVEITCASGLGGISSSWNYKQRPLPKNAIFLDYTRINPLNYDLAIIHFDEFVINTPKNSLLTGWGGPLNWFLSEANIPKIAICHGTPRFLELGNLNVNNLNQNLTLDTLTNSLFIEKFKDILVICNSYQAQKEWGYKKSKVIWQGFDPQQFTSSRYFKNILGMNDLALKQRPHYKGYFFQQETKKYLDPSILIEDTNVTPPNIIFNEGTKDIFSQLMLTNYINFLKEYSIYFNPTIRSPMPRNRGEAMMCGLVTVSAQNHDVDLFIDNEKNGFFTNDPKQAAEYLNFLNKNKSIVQKLGKLSRDCAISYFHINRYLDDWKKTIAEVLGNHIL